MTASSTAYAPATLNWMAQEDAPERRVCRLQGAWNAQGLAREPNTHLPAGTRHVTLDASATTLDTPGALLLVRSMAQWQSAGATVDASGLSPPQQQLLDLVRQRALALPPAARRLGLLGDIGHATLIALDELRALLAFVGELVWRGAPLLLQPWRVRWREVIHEIDAAGLRAIGIIGLLSFLIGMVMAYQAGATLATYGANILIVNLVSIITLRELGPLLTAILVAGRTGSSYTAQIGTMRITEEVDALRALGLSPFEMLVLPKVIALVITLPLLALFADERHIPSLDELARLFALSNDLLRAQAGITRFPAQVYAPDGHATEREVLRIGNFTLLAAGRYLSYDRELGHLLELPRQPAADLLDMADSFARQDAATLANVAIDPSAGQA
ncbi:MAG TPA: ABC transporter permease, partial [Thiomonas arsenitoxydans]|nr:ABC transporter permease [Thiomonas arsenitoxydans]